MYEIFSNLIGGLGLLLIGMNLMTDGLKLASGNALRDILALWTNTRLRGLFSGLLITGIVQSSSAVTVATIGFANAEMLTLEQAMWVIYGSNVGTTMTGWIVAIIGFQANIEVLALPLVGLGALLKLTGGSSKRSSLGLALAGFALLFLGIGFLKHAFDILGSEFTLPVIENPGILTVCLYVLIGFLMTTMMQSSSAAMVIALSAAQSGLVALNVAAAVVIGANLGTTTTAIIAVFGATPVAKRVALSHVSFNLITAVVAIFLLSPLLWAVGFLENTLHLESSPALTLAIFHSVFNILGILLMWPLSRSLVKYLSACFTSVEETAARPRYLDRTVLALPFIATDALALEVSRINTHTIHALNSSLHFQRSNKHLFDEHKVVRKLASAVAGYAAEISRTALTPFLTQVLSQLIESTQQYLLVVDIAEDLVSLSETSRQHFAPDISMALDEYIAAITQHLECQDLSKPMCTEPGTASYDKVELKYRQMKDIILHNTALGNLDMDSVDRLLQFTNQAKRACRQTLKATQRLLTVRASLQRDDWGNVSADTLETNAPVAEETTLNAASVDAQAEIAESKGSE